MAEIQVYAQFPRIIGSNATYMCPSNWHWIHCLTLPIDTLNTLRFSQRPYKWIRYAIGAVTGSQGDLSFSRDSLNLVDYDAGLPLPPDSANVYYHTSDEEKQSMYPVDPKIERSTVTSSMATTRRAGFREEVAERDEWRCVLTGWGDRFCHAVHLLAHSKGDEYILTYTRHRSRDLAGNDIVEAIDSIRNGLFLNTVVHTCLGDDVAFLMTPNFAMDTTDIEPDALPTEKRCTTHLFDLSEALPPFLTSGDPLRISNTTNQWPPDIIFDGVYAGVVLKHFAPQELKNLITRNWGDTFYPKGVTAVAKATDEAIKGKCDMDDKTEKQAEECTYKKCNDKHNRQELDYTDMVMMMPYILVPPDELKDVFREAEEERAEMEQKHVDEKVMAWAKEVSSADGGFSESMP
ncbi:hypothetical protein APHAL10511_005063 [Amanita phalloides]|nr:hypothetical protein APHAL10511_005063 [Amanita phalloides]